MNMPGIPDLCDENFSTRSLDHLGLVSDQMDQLDLIKLIDDCLPLKGNGTKVSMGERVAAMILNGLGFVDTRLYMFPDFLKKKPVARLFGRHMDSAWFNDDSLGRCLDAISDYGVTKLFTELSFTIGNKKGLLGNSVHFDTTSLQLEGEYVNADDEQEAAIPAYGYSKSKRFDLKQMILNLATTGKSQFPIWMESHSGNASDKKVLPNAMARMNDLCKQLKQAESFLYVADSAAYANVLPHSKQLKWLSRVPNSIGLAKQLISRTDTELTWSELPHGYRCHVERCHYAGVDQRWALIFSSQAYDREIKTLAKRITTIKEALEKQWWHMSKQTFQCEKDALKSAKKLARLLKYHQVVYEINPVRKHAKKGRPAKDATPEIVGYQISYKIAEDQAKIEAIKRTKGRFILATNELNESKLSDMAILTEYKAQSGVETGFKFIKDNGFQVDSIFLKTPKRISALMMIMTLCLMVFGLTQYQIREALIKNDETFPNQSKKLIQNPSLKWIYFLFLGVSEVTVKVGKQLKKFVCNVNDRLKQIIGYCGPRAKEIYLGVK